MKKNKSKSKSKSVDKKSKKELETNLIAKLTEVINGFGKVKKAEKAIERFSKKIVKKLSLVGKEVEAPAAAIKPAPVKTLTKPAATTKKTKSTSEVEA